MYVNMLLLWRIQKGGFGAAKCGFGNVIGEERVDVYKVVMGGGSEVWLLNTCC